MQLTKKFSADELRKGILSAVAFERDVRRADFRDGNRSEI